jgi:mannose-6-phosphate isomerase-like protein (cupin superfamily)
MVIHEQRMHAGRQIRSVTLPTEILAVCSLSSPARPSSKLMDGITRYPLGRACRCVRRGGNPSPARQVAQFFFVLAGAAVMEHGAIVTALAAGTGIEIPPGVAHRIVNRSGTDLELLVTSVPPATRIGSRSILRHETSPGAIYAEFNHATPN